ncbi:MAG TPA: site-specific integrase [Stellaceae bacterium]|nr:site-specific integrase [Stellaceae bacterium]
MTFLTDKEELKPGLVIFRRTDVQHRNWYCRIKVPKTDRYKTLSLKTADIAAARDRAYDHDADLRFRVKHDVPIFNRSFSQIAKEYVEQQKRRAATGQVSDARWRKCESVIRARLDPYVGSTQVHLIGQDRWDEYPTWRRETSKGRLREQVSDATIRFEMSIFRAVISFAVKKRYIRADQMFEGRPTLAKMRRDAFSPEEYRKLHTVGRSWMKAAGRPSSVWYRTIAYNFVLIMCNTGMRPSEAKNLRWRDVTIRKDREGRDVAVLRVSGKGKTRELVAPASVADYLDRIRAVAKASEPDDRVFTTHIGKPAKTLYKNMIEDLLVAAKLRLGPSGIPRSTYSFRHTYATFRLSEGIDVYFLAEQMGTSVAMIEDHYGHVSPVKNADRILHGMTGWQPIAAEPEADVPATSKATKQTGRTNIRRPRASQRRSKQSTDHS